MPDDLKITPMLMFTGQAEEAMGFYTTLFRDASIESLQRYGPGSPGPEGKVSQATFRLGGQMFMAIDSAPVHAFTFTPSISFFVTCADQPEVDRLFAALSAGGKVLMPLDQYPFATKFAWVQDRYGVSWQLMLA